MQQVTIHTAKTQLSKLIEAALGGEEIIISRGSKPVARLMPIVQGAFQIGLLQGKLGSGPDFLAPLQNSDLDLWAG